MAGWLAGWGWVVGKSDFNENPVVSLDLDLDFRLQLRLCQKQQNKDKYEINYKANRRPRKSIDQVI